MKRIRFDLPEFFRNPEYYGYLKNISEADFVKLIGSSPDSTAIELLTRKFQALQKDQKSKYLDLLGKYEKLDNNYNDLLNISSTEIDIKEIKPVVQKIKHEATAKVIWSDWHIDEVVEAKTVNGLNKYNPEIARKRSELCAVNTLKLIETQRHAVKVDNLVIHLGGDFIGGWIHEELQQTNSMSPVEATIYAVELTSNALTHIIDNGKFKRIIAICNTGNHGRTTKKVQIANETATNYETIIYGLLNKTFGSEIEFNIAESGLIYHKIYDLLGRYIHGHQYKFGGGIGGLTIPINKKQGEWDKTIKADFNSSCHFHEFCSPNSKTTQNGSLKGYDTYSQHIAAKYQKAIQAFELIDSVHGFTIKAPIICE